MHLMITSFILIVNFNCIILSFAMQLMLFMLCYRPAARDGNRRCSRQMSLQQADTLLRWAYTKTDSNIYASVSCCPFFVQAHRACVSSLYFHFARYSSSISSRLNFSIYVLFRHKIWLNFISFPHFILTI